MKKIATHLIILPALVLILISISSCGPVVTDPMPDIPQTPEYETVRLEYGDSDELEQHLQGIHRQALGTPSEISAFTRRTVLHTNLVLYRHLEMIARIRSNRPTDFEDGLWVWEVQFDGDYIYFEIRDAGEGRLTYLMRLGNSAADNALVLEGEMVPQDRVDGRQQGYGLVHFYFDALHTYDETAPQGMMHLAFRSLGGVRQVLVGLDEVRIDPQNQPLTGIYDYTQLPNLHGSFSFFGHGEFDDGDFNFASTDVAWTATKEGRASTRLSNADSEILLDQCWDAQQNITYKESTPHFDHLSGGELTDCEESLQDVELEAPLRETPDDVIPEIPGAHPEEQ